MIENQLPGDQSLSTPSPSQETTAPRERRQWIVALLLGLVVFGLFVSGVYLFTGSMIDHAFTPDLPWLLGGGRYILENHRLPTHDIFSWTFPHKPWVLYQWLFEVMVAYGQSVLGLDNLLRLFILSVAGLYLIFPLWRDYTRRIPCIFTLAVSTLSLVTITVNMSLRPMIMTTVFLVLQYMLVNAFRQGRISLKLLIAGLMIVYGFWGNMHTGVTIGLFSLLLMALGDQLERTGLYRFIPVDPLIEGKPASLKIYGILALTAFLGSLINPYGYGIYPYFANLTSSPYMDSVIIELQSPNFHYHVYQFFLVLFAALLALMPKVKRVFSAHEILHLLIFTICMLFVQRLVVWTCMFYILFLPKALYQWWQTEPKLPVILRKVILGFDGYRPLIGVSLLIAAGMFICTPQYFQPIKMGKCRPLLKGIAAYQSLKHPGDIVLNDAITGSCTLLNNAQRQKVFIDTRFDFYGDDFMQRQAQADFLTGDWQGFLKQWRINTVVMTKNKPLIKLLEEQHQFQKLYEDKELIILRKRGN